MCSDIKYPSIHLFIYQVVLNIGVLGADSLLETVGDCSCQERNCSFWWFPVDALCFSYAPRLMLECNCVDDGRTQRRTPQTSVWNDWKLQTLHHVVFVFEAVVLSLTCELLRIKAFVKWVNVVWWFSTQHPAAVWATFHTLLIWCLSLTPLTACSSLEKLEIIHWRP